MWVDGFPRRIRKVNHKPTKYVCGSLLQLACVFIFSSLLYVTYTENANADFLSLSRTAGACSSVPITTSQGVLLDSYGHWETDRKFVKQEALYFVQFSEYDGDDGSWNFDMANLNSVINTELDFLKATDDYPLKVLHLVSWRATISAKKGGTITVWFNADPKVIFEDLLNFEAYIGKPSDGCRSNNAWRYSNGKYLLTFNDVWDGSGAGIVSKLNPGNFTYSCASFDFLQLGFNWDYPTRDFDLEVDIRSTLIAAAVNAGIISRNDLLIVSDTFYSFMTDDQMPVMTMYDPKFQMSSIYFDSTDVAMIRVGNTLLVPSFNGIAFAKTASLGTQANPYQFCPAMCETSSTFCSGPAFIMEYRPPTNGYMAELNALAGFQHLEFGFDAYADEVYVLNDAKMDPGRIGCKTTQAGSRGKLGNLEPIPFADVLKTMESSKPFKLAENYFFCSPNRNVVFIESIGIAQGNSNIICVFLVMVTVLSLSAMGLLHSTVSQLDLDSTSILIAEIVKIKQKGGNLRDEHRELLATLAVALKDEWPKAHLMEDTSLENSNSQKSSSARTFDPSTSRNKPRRPLSRTTTGSSSFSNAPKGII